MRHIASTRLRCRPRPVPRTFDGLARQQLVIYAQELSEHLREEEDLERTLQEREERLRRVAAAAIAAQEEEREWIALEVHDRIAQTLASVFQQLQALESMIGDNSGARQTAVRASKLLRDAIRESRNIMNDLHPPVLAEYGVVSLIEDELHQFQEHSGVRVELAVDYRRRAPREMEIALYRIFHEALINIRRHATGATRVAVSLCAGDEAITLAVEDDGPGFDVEAATRVGRVGGLLSMRRRAEVLGGVFEVASAPGAGTRVAARLAIPSDGRRNHGGA